MSRLRRHVVFLLPIILAGCGFNHERVPDEDVDPVELQAVQSLTERIMDAMRNGGYYQLTEDEAEKRMVTGLNEERQRSAYEQISGAYGDYRGVKFQHVMRRTDGKKYRIYRFKGVFDPDADEVEIRATVNAKGKLAGFYLKPWVGIML